MKSSTRALRRAGVALAAAGACALSVTAASAATTQPALRRHAPPACRAWRLTTWMGIPGSGAAGHIYYVLEFSNTSHGACTLRGYPTVRSTFNGVNVGPKSSHDTMFKAMTVVLRPRATAHAVLTIDQAGAACPGSEVQANGLKIFPPGVKAGTPVSFGSFQVCSTPTVLHVRVVRRGTGIPNYSQ